MVLLNFSRAINYIQSLSDVNDSGLVQLNDCTCLGYTQTFECTVFGAGYTIWNSTLFDCSNQEIRLRHSRYSSVDSPANGECNQGSVMAKSIGIHHQCYISHLTVTIEEEMINSTIECSAYNIAEMHMTRTTIDQISLIITTIP